MYPSWCENMTQVSNQVVTKAPFLSKGLPDWSCTLLCLCPHILNSFPYSHWGLIYLVEENSRPVILVRSLYRKIQQTFIKHIIYKNNIYSFEMEDASSSFFGSSGQKRPKSSSDCLGLPELRQLFRSGLLLDWAVSLHPWPCFRGSPSFKHPFLRHWPSHWRLTSWQDL